MPVKDLKWCTSFIVAVHHLKSRPPFFVTPRDVTRSQQKPSFVFNAHKILVLLKTVQRNDIFFFYLPRAHTNRRCNSSAVSGTPELATIGCHCGFITRRKNTGVSFPEDTSRNQILYNLMLCAFVKQGHTCTTCKPKVIKNTETLKILQEMTILINGNIRQH